MRLPARLREEGGFSLVTEYVLLIIVTVVVLAAVTPVLAGALRSFTARVAVTILQE